MNILLTSGGTKVKIDRVRHLGNLNGSHLGNMSSGTFGAKIAKKLLAYLDVHLTFFMAEGSKSPFKGEVNWARGDSNDSDQQLIELIKLRQAYTDSGDRYNEQVYKSLDEYVEMMDVLLTDNDAFDTSKPDVVILAAAVSDFKVKNYVDGKIRSADNLSIELEPAPKVISTIKERCPEALLVGFKLLVDSTDTDLIAAAQQSAIKNGCDLVIANDLRDMQESNHRLLLVTKDGLKRTVGAKHDDPDYLAEIVADCAVELADAKA